ncbi:hypothetical protein LX64_00808 [Chitinophaga skermanii]|uniref:Uncharacterized protein n=1 Tax=Chitinophaga skermanii TaxID=331697 RepID=A0A327R2Z0_9BACT|nr:hypothetical protein [Chitinophaga skermanii]RAJ11199.1 hypothetical protein LX64_00808 [Chitinophaga skermanii]
MTNISNYGANAIAYIDKQAAPMLIMKPYAVYLLDDGLYVVLNMPNCRIALRMVHLHGATFFSITHTHRNHQYNFTLQTHLATYQVNLQLPSKNGFLHFTCSITPKMNFHIGSSPRDLILLDHPEPSFNGEIYASQVGPRTGFIFGGLKNPYSGSFFYVQNFTLLNEYCEQTQTNINNTVGGQWPELGFALPSKEDKPLTAGTTYTISDVYFKVVPGMLTTPTEIATTYLSLLAEWYQLVPKPGTQYQHWPTLANKTMRGLQHNPGCWLQVKGKQYLNAYVCDYKTPPEIMVQLSASVPLEAFSRWRGKKFEIVQQLIQALDQFYDDNTHAVLRWLPAAAHSLDGSEEHKQPNVMDAWYIHHALYNLSVLAERGYKNAEQLFFNSVDFVIKVARHFQYRWPIFFDIHTLAVIKAEAQPGKGGEKDVAGLYALVMLQAWELTREEKYFQEAVQAANALASEGFKMLYQSNNTAFAAVAMLRLYAETKQTHFLEQSYICMANLFVNTAFWECKYGNSKHYPTFFSIFPLDDANYAAAYEERDIMNAFREYLLLAPNDVLPALRDLLPEYIRYTIHRAPYYYPPNLPADIIATDVRMGEIDRDLWIPLEDFQIGYEPLGQVGQEVYGLGLPFEILTHHYIRLEDVGCYVFLDYPFEVVSAKTGQSITLQILGSAAYSCRLVLVCMNKAVGNWEVIAENKVIHPGSVEKGLLEFTLAAQQTITIRLPQP